METHVFIDSSGDPIGPYIPRPNISQPSYMKISTLVVLVVLATAGISAGITFYCVESQVVCRGVNNQNKTTSYWKVHIKDNYSAQYDVFTVPKDGNYFIHGHLWKKEEKNKIMQQNAKICNNALDSVWLWKKLRSLDKIAETTFCCNQATFGCELHNVTKDTKIWFEINLGKLNLKKTVFHIYKL